MFVVRAGAAALATDWSEARAAQHLLCAAQFFATARYAAQHGAHFAITANVLGTCTRFIVRYENRFVCTCSVKK